jgi:hypothetical protein
MASSPKITLTKVRRDLGYWVTQGSNASTHRARATAPTTAFLGLSEQCPHLYHTSTAGR